MCKGAGSNSFDMHYLLKKLEDIFLLHVATSLAIANPLNIQTMPVKWFACYFIGKKNQRQPLLDIRYFSGCIWR